MGIFTGRLITELIYAHESEMQRLVMSGGVDIVPVTQCIHTFPADPWYVLFVTSTTVDSTHVISVFRPHNFTNASYNLWLARTYLYDLCPYPSAT
jgi:hypothetical protein